MIYEASEVWIYRSRSFRYIPNYASQKSILIHEMGVEELAVFDLGRCTLHPHSSHKDH